MSDWQHFIKGKKVTVMGLGLLGRGLGHIRFLAEQGARLIVTDLKSKEALSSSLAQLAGLKDITYVLGEHRLEDFQNRDFILKAAGVPLDSPYIAEARRQGIPVEMSTSLFAAYTPAAIIGITGTRGKSTVTHLLHAILTEHIQYVQKARSQSRVFLGGNVRGVSTLPLLAETKTGDFAVLELDSWQLQGFAERRISPHLSIFTTFLPDHLNYYKGDMEAYFSDKAAIFLNQKPDDIFVIGRQVAESSYFLQYQQKYQKTRGRNFSGKMIVADASDLPSDWQPRLLGQHNRYNIGLALSAARALDIPDATSKKVVEMFAGVPGRLEHVRDIDDIQFYNDTTATTPDATVVALDALHGVLETRGGKIVLIMGGNDKGLDMSALIQKIQSFAVAGSLRVIILLPGTGTDRIISQLKAAAHVSVLDAGSMAEVVKKAREAAAAGDCVLLSPAFASFGLFANEFDRGEQFNHHVSLITN